MFIFINGIRYVMVCHCMGGMTWWSFRRMKEELTRSARLCVSIERGQGVRVAWTGEAGHW